MDERAYADRLGELDAVTREYARYSRSAGGLAWVLGGVLAIVSYLAGGLHSGSPAVSAGLIAIPAAWLLARELLARPFYQALGRVEERSTPGERRWRWVLAAYTVVVAAFVLLRLAVAVPRWSPGTWGYAAVVAAMPVVVWLWLRTPMEYVVGVFLICQAAVAFTGRGYPLWGVATVFPAAAALMIAAGIRDHRRYRTLRRRIQILTGEDAR